MDARSRKERPLSTTEGYRIEVHWQGRKRRVRVHSPRSAFAFIERELGVRKEQLIRHAQDIIKNASMAEDIVQSSYTNAYCRLNNGKLYVLKIANGYLFVRGGKNVDPSRAALIDGQTIQHWLFNRQNKSDMEVIEKPVAWFKTIVHNNACKYYEQQKKYRAFCMTPKNWSLIEEVAYPGPEHLYLRAERRLEIRQLVAALPPRYREIVQLRFFEEQDYSFQEIATHLGRPVGTVTSQASRAMKMIEEAMEGKRVLRGNRLVRQKKSAS